MTPKNFEDNDWYQSNYSEVNATAVKGSTANKILHRLIEKPFKSNANLNLLEVGSNTGEHLEFVVPDFASYLMTDIRALSREVFIDRENDRIKFEVADVQALQYPDETFDRVISTCLFHHLNDPLSGFSEIRRVTKIGGTVSILIPNDPGIFYRILRHATTNRNARKRGIKAKAKLNHALEHRNHYLQLTELMHEIFKFDRVIQDNFPFHFKGYDLNALTTFHIERIN
jgi:phosphatidylethanolamine/phosphatidyl-N-methylethanolamine N-methyltransferase